MGVARRRERGGGGVPGAGGRAASAASERASLGIPGPVVRHECAVGAAGSGERAGLFPDEPDGRTASRHAGLRRHHYFRGAGDSVSRSFHRICRPSLFVLLRTCYSG